MGKYNKKIEEKEEIKINFKPEIILPPKISLNEYLTSFSIHRKQDKVIQKWYQAKDPTNPKKTKDEWDIIINSFFGVVSD